MGSNIDSSNNNFLLKKNPIFQKENTHFSLFYISLSNKSRNQTKKSQEKKNKQWDLSE